MKLYSKFCLVFLCFLVVGNLHGCVLPTFDQLLSKITNSGAPSDAAHGSSQTAQAAPDKQNAPDNPDDAQNPILAMHVTPDEIEEAKRSPSYVKYPGIAKMNKFFDIQITGGINKKKDRSKRDENNVDLRLVKYKTFDLRAEIKPKADSGLQFPVTVRIAYALRTVEHLKGRSWMGIVHEKKAERNNVVRKEYTLNSAESVVRETIPLEYTESAINENVSGKAEMKLDSDPEVFADVISLLDSRDEKFNMKFVLIPAGSFMMGRFSKVKMTIDKPFYLGKYEVTQEQWESVMYDNPSQFKGRNNPVELVSCNDVQEFIRRLNKKEGHNRYRLPTSAEWEYAARAGTNDTWFFGGRDSDLSNYDWWIENSGKTTHPVGQKPPNPWGLHDVNGNVTEWVKQDGSRGAVFFTRGGSWSDYIADCVIGQVRIIRRNGSSDYRDSSTGFRLALTPE